MLETIVTSSVLIAVLTLLRRVFRGKIKLGLQYALWLLVAVRLLMPVSLFRSPISVLNVTERNSQTERISQPIYLFPEGEVSDFPDTFDVGNADVGNQGKDTDVTINTPASSGYLVQDRETGEVVRYAAKTSLGEILRTVWLIGMAAVGLWFAVQNVRFYRGLRITRAHVRMPHSRRPVYLTRVIDSPCLFGLFCPVVYLPLEISVDRQALQYILAHEETHYRHGDHFWSFLRCVCLAVHWFNPLVWLAAVLSRRDAELACDEGALKCIGEEHRKAYGNTLINMTASRMRPSDLLCGATTMTSSKKGIKERITMIANKPKMLFSTLVAIMLFTGVIVGCTFTGARTTAEARPLTDEELAYFHNEFFNGSNEDFNFYNQHGDAINFRNQFLNSLYSSPEEINLKKLFVRGNELGGMYNYSDVIAEFNKLATRPWADPNDESYRINKISRENIDALLKKYMGITLEQTGEIGLESFAYSEEFDAYYFASSLDNYPEGYTPSNNSDVSKNVTFSSGEREGDLIRLFYANYMLTLREKSGNYLFVSNQRRIESGRGYTIAVSVPSNVAETATEYVRQQYEYYSGSRIIDGKWQMANEPASCDDWRIEGLTQVYSYGEEVADWPGGLETLASLVSLPSRGLSLDVYRLDYRIHTTTPDKVPLAGSMEPDDEGWIMPAYPSATYLVFLRESRSPIYALHNSANNIYLFSMIESNCNPGDETFTSKLKALFSVMGETPMVTVSEQLYEAAEAYNHGNDVLIRIYSYSEIDGQFVNEILQPADGNDWQSLEVIQTGEETPTYLIFAFSRFQRSAEFLFPMTEADGTPGDETFTKNLKALLDEME